MNFGLAGAGGIGHIRAAGLAQTPGCELVGVTDVDPDRARSVTAPAARVFERYEEMLAAPEVEAVVVSTPPQFHEAMVVSALESGKHVLCEKPLAGTVEACRRMVEASRRTGKLLTTGFNHRYFPAIQFVKETLDSGRIGQLDHVRAFAGHTGLSEFKAPWMYDKEVMGGGTLMDNGIHLIDLTRYLLGDVTEVYGVATSNVWKLDRSEDNGFALLRSSAGKTAVLHSSWTEWKGYRFHIEAYGDRGMARAYYAPMMSTAVFLDEPGGRATRQRNLYPGNIIQEKLHGWQSTVIKTFQQEFTDFMALCATGAAAGQNRAIADGFAGFRATEIADAVYRSTESRQAVSLTPPF